MHKDATRNARALQELQQPARGDRSVQQPVLGRLREAKQERTDQVDHSHGPTRSQG